MKTLILSTLLLTCFLSNGQKQVFVDTASRSIDSLYKSHCTTVRYVRQHYPDIPTPSNVFKTLITKYGGDSTIFLFSDTTQRPLFRLIEIFGKSGCRLTEIVEIFSPAARLYYRERWQWSCEDSTNRTKDPDIRDFDAIVYEKERFAYDANGQLETRVWWYTSIGLREYKYKYENNKIETEVKRKESDKFWE